MRAEQAGDSLMSQAGRYLGVGMTWALSTALFLYVGKLVDDRFGTRPWFTLIGALIGAAAGLYYLIHTLTASAGKPSGRAQDREEKK